jgi:hypothetical protein
MRTIKPLYAARLEDLGPGDFVQVRCVCGHEELLPGLGFIQGMKLRPLLHVLDLVPKMRCRECDTKGKVDISVKWEEKMV